MSTSNGTNMTLVCAFALTGMAFAVHHAWKFDRCRCLVPRKKDWFRVLLTWMLFMTIISMSVWAIGWTYVKYKLGWVLLPGVGAVPFPNQLWADQYKAYNLPLTFCLNLGHWLQVCLNAEEGLYWYHLMRAVRTPKSASSWLKSSFFYGWIGICFTCAIIQFGVSWIRLADMVTQAGRMFAAGGIIELLVVLSSSIVILKFPAFLRDVKNSGAGPEVRARLHFYHEANKVRTFFRVIFSITLAILGFDGLTDAKKINMNHMASDMLQQIAFGAYYLAFVVNVVLYLPRNFYGTSAPHSRVMVGAQHPSPPDRHPLSPEGHLASNALMSLLREGGQWDEIDDQAFERTRESGVPGDTARDSSKVHADGSYRLKGEIGWDDGASAKTGPRIVISKESDPDLEQGMAPRVLENWQTPFAVPMTDELPKQLRIMVQREVEHDGALSGQ